MSFLKVESVANLTDSKRALTDSKKKLMKECRMKLSPPSMLSGNGDIYQGYFNQTYGKWTDVEKAILRKGMSKHGIHSFSCWSKIQAEFLPTKDISEIYIQISKTIGRQDLRIYEAKETHFPERSFAYEHKKLRVLGESKGCWKRGIFNDDKIEKNSDNWMVCGNSILNS